MELALQAPLRSAAIAGLAASAMRAELEAYPKPGLVSAIDSGAHHDMDHALMLRSITAIEPLLARLAEAGAAGAGFQARLLPLGIEAERRMLDATGGVNAHRGAIFCMGMLAAAAGSIESRADAARPDAVRAALLSRWGDELAEHAESRRVASSNGAVAARRFHAHGAADEAAAGFPSIFEYAVPALRAARMEGLDESAARIHTLMTLISELEDTNLLHRGGREGAEFARAAAREFLRGGGCYAPAWREHALKMHREFTAARLSPGGSADLLAAAEFTLALSGSTT